MILTLAAFFFVLSIVVFVHEFGHFFVAKLNRVYVVTFSFGFGPKILKKKIGETEYALSAIPFGGYVKFAGETEGEEAEEEEDVELIDVPRDRLYKEKAPLQKMSIVLAGPFMNFVLAILVYIVTVWVQGVFVSPNSPISEVVKKSPAYVAGLNKGDLILSINGKKVVYWDDIYEIVNNAKGHRLSLTFLRGTDTLTTRLKPEFDSETGAWKIGVVYKLPSRVGNVKKDSPAYKAGIRPGAVVTAVNDTSITYYDELEKMVHPRPGIPLKFTWVYQGKTHSATIVPSAVDAASGGDRLEVVKVGQIGVGPFYERKKVSFIQSVKLGTNAFNNLFVSIMQFLGKLFTGKASIKALGGPIRVGQMAGDMARWGFSYLVYFLAFFSLNLAIFNLFPILPFDGGHFVIYLGELVTSKKLNIKTQQVMMQIGYIILILLMVFVFSMDLINIFK
ncbi:RIP metalloprotease RseP [bacterium]|nr:MAG: RIP metalloprotease RseP [bacterium]